VFSDNPEELRTVPLPDDDDSNLSNQILEIIYKRHETTILEIAKQMGSDLHSDPNMMRHVMSHCYRQNEFFWFVSSNSNDNSLEDMENCIKQMRELNKKDPNDLMKFQNICNHVGLEYRREYLRQRI
jgi:hypothetical protein